jgi:hypothetical protein
MGTRTFVKMQEMNSTYSMESCQPTLSDEGLMQDAVCDVLPYSSTKGCICRSNFLEIGACGDECGGGDSDKLCRK